MNGDAALLARIDAAFGEVARPHHFTDFAHCAECAAHDERLQACPGRALELEDVAYAAWDPFCVALPASFTYFFPALARLALATPDIEHDWYGSQLLFHLAQARHGNGFHAACTPAQRATVAALLGHLLESRAALIDADRARQQFLDSHRYWSEALVVLN